MLLRFFNKVPAPIRTRINLWKQIGRPNRRLELGPGSGRIDSVETLNIVDGPNVDYVSDATKRLPFDDGTFELIYASHILEHVPWYQTEDVLREWVRILQPAGQLEIWVPNGLSICKAFVDAEENGDNYIHQDGWYKFNKERDPCKWAAGRIFTYGDGNGASDDPNWHRAIFSPRYLQDVMERAGLDDVCEMDRSQVRGHDHGWINLGMRGVK